MSARIRGPVLLLLGMASAALAQQQARLLLPIAPGTVAGANGSVWETELVLANSSTYPLVPLQLADGRTIAPGGSLIVRELPPCPTPGAILIVNDPVGPALRERMGATLRTRDLSRSFETWGTTLPVVELKNYYYSNLALNDVPLDPQFRSMLRMYVLDPIGRSPGFIVRFYEIGNAETADRLLLTLNPRDPSDVVDTSKCARSIGIPLESLPELAGIQGRIRIEVDGQVNASTRPYWAFVSVTHNRTQHVTLILPQ